MKWRKSSYSSSGGATCVEVGNDTRRVVVRDTKQRHMTDAERTAVPFTPSAWQEFTASLRK